MSLTFYPLIMSSDLNMLQADIDDFAQARNWSSNKTSIVYNMIANISEELGEVWNVIKWIDNDKDLLKISKENHDELKDGIGDLLWCVARLATIFNVDMYEALQMSLEDYEQRFPAEKVKGKHGNRKLGGVDGKYDGLDN